MYIRVKIPCQVMIIPFCPLEKDRKRFQRKPLKRQDIWETVKKYARAAGIDADRVGKSGVGFTR